MSTKLNAVGLANAHSLVAAGKINTGKWDFTADDGNKLLGDKGDQWNEYAKWFLATHPDQTDQTKAYYGYPFGKDGEVYRNAVVSAKGRAAAQGVTEVEAACTSLLDLMDQKKFAPVQRAYSLLEIKDINDDERTITGIASTPETDRMGDIVNPKGAQYKLPIPLLWQHDSETPIGWVEQVKVTSSGIQITARIAKGVTQQIEDAWSMIKAGLVRGLSIGFRGIDTEQIPNSWGVDFKTWEWLELSAVTIPANASASIQSVKSLDRAQRAASGNPVVRTVRAILAGVSAKTPAKTPQEGKPMNVQDQIKQFQSTRAAKATALEEIMTKNEGETLDGEQSDKYDELENEISSIDKHLKRLETTQTLLARKATTVPAIDLNEKNNRVNADIAQGGHHRVIAVEEKLDKGIGFSRFVKSMAANGGNAREALEWAKDRYPDYSPLHDIIKMHIGQGQSARFIEKATVDSGQTANAPWAGSLVQYQNLANDFIEFLRPQTIIGKIAGFNRVPFKVRVPRQTGGGTASWVGEGKAKPLTSLAFDTVTLDFTKLATIAVLTDEVIRLSSPAADAITRNQLAAALIQQMDSDFVDPANAGTANVKPASITNGVTPVVAAGTNTQAGIATDIMNVMAPWLAANVDPTGGVWIMTPTTAMALGLMLDSLGTKLFPDINMNGGSFNGLPVVTSQATGLVGASDGSHIVILLKASDILLADDGTVAIDISREASLEMSDSPAGSSVSGTGASLVSMFQTNSVAIRAERWVNWVKGRSTAAQYLTGVHWGGFPS